MTTIVSTFNINDYIVEVTPNDVLLNGNISATDRGNIYRSIVDLDISVLAPNNAAAPVPAISASVQWGHGMNRHTMAAPRPPKST